MTNKMNSEYLASVQRENETNIINDSYDVKSLNFERNITKNTEYNLSYGMEAINIIAPIVTKTIREMFNKNNQHTRKFYWNIIRPAQLAYNEMDAKKRDANKSPIKIIADSTAVTLTATMSKGLGLTKTAAAITKQVMFSLNMDHEERAEYYEDALAFFIKIIFEVAENSKCSIFSVEQEDNRDYMLIMTEEWQKKIDVARGDATISATIYKPMIVKPIPHTSLMDKNAGYLVQKSPLLKHPSKRANGKIYQELLDFNAETQPEFFSIINKVQETAYCVNHKLLGIMKEAYLNNKCFKDFPVEMDEDLVIEIATKRFQEAQKNNDFWAEKKGTEPRIVSPKYLLKVAHEERNKMQDNVNKTMALLNDAAVYDDYEEIFYPIFLDHRCRRYPYATSGLTYQGDELAKALLHTAKKRKLTEEGFEALWDTLANALGLDKEILDLKRPKAIQFFEENLHKFITGDYNIFFYDRYAEARGEVQYEFDEPVTALAICLELVEIVKDPDYETGIIVHRDARVSGSSIIGTILRDKDVMQMTSVLDFYNEASGKLGDAYTACADTAYALVKKDAENGVKEALRLMPHTDFFTRKYFKSIVMCYASYGLSDFGLREKTAEYDGWDYSDEEGLNIAVKKYLDKKVIESLEATLPSCFGYLAAAKGAAKEVIKRDGEMMFISPINKFPVIMRKNKCHTRRVSVQCGLITRQISINCYKKDTDATKTAREVAPGIVHHLDSALLYLVNKFEPEIEFTFIHDSVGSHPNDVNRGIKAYAKGMYLYSRTDVFDRIFGQFNTEHSVPKVDNCSNEELMSIQTSMHILV